MANRVQRHLQRNISPTKRETKMGSKTNRILVVQLLLMAMKQTPETNEASTAFKKQRIKRMRMRGVHQAAKW